MILINHYSTRDEFATYQPYKLFLSLNTSDLFFCKIDPVILKPHYSEHLCVSDTFFESRMKLFTWKDLNIADRTGKK